MKAVICTHDQALHIHTPGTGDWQVCQCGHTGAKWEDPHKGTLIVACLSNRDHVRVLGLNNQLLVPAVAERAPFWEMYRQWHLYATQAPDHVFDSSRAGCWAVVFTVGSTGDTRWATDGEYLEFCRASARVQAGDSLVRDILEALCRRDGLSLESTIPGALPGEPARNYELAGRLGIGHVFGLKEQP